MSLAGRNTPRSVLAYIDAHLTYDEVDPVELARELPLSELHRRKRPWEQAR